MTGIDNNFVNRYVGYKKDGISPAELSQIKKDSSAQAYTTEGAHALAREIIKDGKIDKDEQNVLQAIGQGAKDITVAQKYAHAIDPTDSDISRLIMMGFKNKAQAAVPTQDVSKMANTQKIIEAFKGSLKYVAPELRARLEQMLTPKNLTIMSGVLAAYAGSHALGVGFVADGILFGLGALALGKDAIDVAKKLGGFATNSINAKTPQDLDMASRQLGSAMATVISDLPALIGIKNMKVTTKSIGLPVPTMRPVMTASGAAVLAPALEVVTVTGRVIQLSKAQQAAIGATVMMANGNPGGGGEVSSSGGGSSLPKIPIKSNVKNNSRIAKLAEETFRGNDQLRTEANHLIGELTKGNITPGPGIGTKPVFGNILEARGRNGARVYFQYNKQEGLTIVGYSNKSNQQAVINSLKEIYK